MFPSSGAIRVVDFSTVGRAKPLGLIGLSAATDKVTGPVYRPLNARSQSNKAESCTAGRVPTVLLVGEAG